MNKRIFTNMIVVLITTFFLVSCDMFSTREPELPSSGKSTFIPATEPNIVIENFKNALLEKNTDNYVSCFADTTSKSKTSFSYVASGAGLAAFPSTFDYWGIDSERRYFNSLIGNIHSDLSILLVLSSTKLDFVSPDSTLFIADYQLQTPHNITDLPKEFRGSLQFTLSKQSNGLWTINRWIDNNPKLTDTVTYSWSILKARLSN